MKEEKSLSKQNIFETQVVDFLFNDPTHQHQFYKHFFALSYVYGIHYDQQFVQAYKQLIDQRTDILKYIEKGFLLYHFLYDYGRHELAQQIIESIVQSLTKLVKQNAHNTHLWKYLFRGCCALIQTHNQTFQIQEAWTRIEAANEIAESLKATSIGQF